MSILHHWRLALVLTVALFAALVVIWQPAWIMTLPARFESDNIAALVAQAGMWGPVLVITMMVLAIVMSPIPSAPIAMAGGLRPSVGHDLRAAGG